MTRRIEFVTQKLASNVTCFVYKGPKIISQFFALLSSTVFLMSVSSATFHVLSVTLYPSDFKSLSANNIPR